MRKSRTIWILTVVGGLLAGSCSSDPAGTTTSRAPESSTTAPPTTTTTAPTTTTTTATVSGEHLGVACRYTNPFTGDDECLRYIGEGWDDASRADDCAAPFSTVEGTLVSEGCAAEEIVGTCRVDAGGPEETITYYYAGDTSMLGQFCANPGGGVWADSGATEAAPTGEMGDLQLEAADALVGTDSVAVDPECIDEFCVGSLVEDRGAIEFTPRSQPPTAGLILLPGASVDVRAYAPLAQIIAEAGFFVALVPVPGGVSLGNEDRVDDVVAAHPEIDTWIVGGHSLGGVAAASYAANEGAKETVSGLVLWASYIDDQAALPEIETPVTSIYGSEDGLTTVGEVEASRVYLPEDTWYVEIEGGNHAQFGFYGDQEGDGVALIPHRAQARLAAQATVHFLAGVADGQLQTPDFRYEAANELERSWCALSQETIANLASELPEVSVDELRSEEAFIESKPSVDDSGVVRVPMHRFQIGQYTVRDSPAILTGELWCKHKSQDFLVERGATPAGDAGSCAMVNSAAWEWALEQLTETERTTWDSAGLEVVLAPDVDYDAGPAWLAGSVGVERNNTTVTITSARLTVAEAAGLDDPQNTGLTYCKLWTPAEALRLALNP